MSQTQLPHIEHDNYLTPSQKKQETEVRRGMMSIYSRTEEPSCSLLPQPTSSFSLSIATNSPANLWWGGRFELRALGFLAAQPLNYWVFSFLQNLVPYYWHLSCQQPPSLDINSYLFFFSIYKWGIKDLDGITPLSHRKSVGASAVFLLV
jgi:hypothetical protein